MYVKSSSRLRRIATSKHPRRIKVLPINKNIKYDFSPPICCPKCAAEKIARHSAHTKTIYDIKFSPSGVKRWIVKYSFYYYYCLACKAVLIPATPWTRHKYGLQLLAYIVYQIIELRLPLNSAKDHINQLFGFNMHPCIIRQQKSRACKLYQGIYNRILEKISTGRLVHADETRVKIEGKENYVWVFTNLEEVVFVYAETREGNTVKALLQEFKGVLVSDFYSAYDALECDQQKCLIHLIRDLNDDLLNHPFDMELKVLVSSFSMLLKPIVETVDRFGLKSHFLKRHKEAVEKFYSSFTKYACATEIMSKYKQRFEKNRKKLFTFLDHDGIPWNNNNAETAIKRFAALREMIEGSNSVDGVREYLTLLSIRETCRYKGISFLDFLRSGEQDIDEFIRKSGRRSSQIRDKNSGE